MATAITERPHLYSFNLNEIRYVLHVTDPSADGCKVEVELYYQDIDAVEGVLLKTFLLTPSTDGDIYCHVADYLDSLLSPELPNLEGDTVQPISDQVKKFWIRFRENTDAGNGDWTTDEADKRIVLLGGVEQRAFKRNNFFATYLPATKAFLTWQPSNRFVFADETHFLTFLLLESADFTVKVKAVYTDGVVDTTVNIINDAGDDVLFRISAGANALGLPGLHADKELYYYELTVVKTADDTELAAPYRFYLEYRPLYSFYDIIFFNSLGGIDAVRVKGQVDISIETTNEELEHTIYKDALNGQQPQKQFSQSNVLKRDNYDGDAGWCRTPDQQEALVELLVSKGRYEIFDGRWIPIVNLKKTMKLRSNADKVWSFPIEWSYGFADKVFTPKKIALGLGVAGVIVPPPAPPCVAVGLPLVFLPDASIDTPYNYSFNATGSQPFALADIIKPAWMTIAIVGSSIVLTGTPSDEATDVTVSFTVTNCSSDSAAFNDLIDVLAELPPPAGKSVTIINQSGTPIQITADGELYPAAGTNAAGNFEAVVSNNFSISSGVGPYRGECFTSFDDPYPFVLTFTNVTVGQVLPIDVTNINYIRIFSE